jgi:DNA modification methylase
MPTRTREPRSARAATRTKKPSPKGPVNDLDPSRWREYDEGLGLQFGTIWSFPERDATSVHRGDYRGNFAPQIARQCLLRFTRQGETVLDCFLGSGTTLIEAKRLGRRGIGVEVNPATVALARQRISRADGADRDLWSPLPEAVEAFEQGVREGDARDLSFLGDGSIDCVVTHPPYYDIIKYSDAVDGDLSLLASYEGYLEGMRRVYAEVLRVLKPGRHLCLLIGDAWRGGELLPIGLDVFQAGRQAGFAPIAIIVKEQHNISGKRGAMGIWKWRSIKWNMFLFQHEYLLVFRKPA